MVKLRERYETLSVYYIHLEEKSDPEVFKENYLVHINKLEKTKEEKEQAYSSAMAAAKQKMDQVRAQEGQSRETGGAQQRQDQVLTRSKLLSSQKKICQTSST